VPKICLKKLLKSCYKVVKNLAKICQKVSKNLETGRRRRRRRRIRRRRRRRFVAPRPGTTLVKIIKKKIKQCQKFVIFFVTKLVKNLVNNWSLIG
jgi:hypothetical protein